MEGGDKGRERDIWCAVVRGGTARYRVRGRCAVEGEDKGRVRGGGRGARYPVRGRCAVEGVDKGRERDIGSGDGACAVEGVRGGSADGARWRAGSCADGARWRGGSAISGARTVRGQGADGARGRACHAVTISCPNEFLMRLPFPS